MKLIWTNFGVEQKDRWNSLASKRRALTKADPENEGTIPKQRKKNRDLIRRWECPTCGYTTTHGGHYTQHLKVHDKSNRLPCPYCEYTAARPWHIKEGLNFMKIYTAEFV